MLDDPTMNQKYFNRLFQWAKSNRDKSKVLHLGLKEQLWRYRIGESCPPMCEKSLTGLRWQYTLKGSQGDDMVAPQINVILETVMQI